MIETSAIDASLRPWSLAALADEAEFGRHVEMTASTIANRFTVNVHINVAARARAFDDWIEHVRAGGSQRIDYRTLVAIGAGLIASMAAHRIVGYTATIVEPRSMLDTVQKYGNEVTALAMGTALYSTMVEAISGAPAVERLPVMVMENAAANLRRHPEAALRFRELMRLSTPWM